MNTKIIQVLSEVYWAEIGSVGIYMDQHVKCEDMGYSKFAEALKEDAVDEMKHAELLAQRVLFLGGALLNQKHMVPVETQKEIVAFLNTNISIEEDAIARLNNGITVCLEEKDHGTRLLLEEILKSEESHVDRLRTTLDCVKRYGDQYIVTHLM